MVPYDQKSPFITSGIRIGTPALTTRGMKENEMMFIANIIHDILSDIDNNSVIEHNKPKVLDLCKNFGININSKGIKKNKIGLIRIVRENINEDRIYFLLYK